MITVVHGDDIGRSREFFLSEKKKARNPVSFDRNIELSLLVQTVEGGSLFSESKDIFIENFFTDKKSNSTDFEKIIDFISKKSETFNFMFWEPGPLERKYLKVFKQFSQVPFSHPQSMFLFLDQIKPGNISNIELFHNALKQSNEDIMFHMLIRQVRLLISVSNPTKDPISEIKRLAPWQKSKLEKQSRFFSKEKLLEFYNLLFDLNTAQRSGTMGQTLPQCIDILLLKI